MIRPPRWPGPGGNSESGCLGSTPSSNKAVSATGQRRGRPSTAFQASWAGSHLDLSSMTNSRERTASLTPSADFSFFSVSLQHSKSASKALQPSLQAEAVANNIAPHSLTHTLSRLTLFFCGGVSPAWVAPVGSYSSSVSSALHLMPL